MEQVPRTVRERLAAQQIAAEHPDADLLTAYAENTLAGREREGVIAHLSRCHSCREVLVLAAPEAAAVITPAQVATATPKRSWFTLPALRWVTAAAAIAVVGAAVTLRHSFLAPKAERVSTTATYEEPKPQADAYQYSAPAAEPKAQASETQLKQPASKKALALSKPSTPKDARTQRSQPMGNQAADNLSRDNPLARADQSQFGLTQPKARLSAAPAAPERQMASAGRAESPSFKQAPVQSNAPAAMARLEAPPAAPPLHNAPLKAAQSNAVTVAKIPPAPPTPAAQPGVANQTVEVSAASAPVTIDAGQSNVEALDKTKLSENETADARAKRPAISPETAVGGMKTGVSGKATGYSMADAYVAKDVVCSVIADGVRCVSGQRKTEMHQPDAKLKAIASQGSVIWAGGDVLLRSDDAGVTWKEVKKPFTDAIAQIVVMDDAVYVRTTDGTMWKTADGGASWVQSQATK